MRWTRFEHEGSAKLGQTEDGRIQPVAARSMQEVIRGEGLDPAGDPVTVEDVRFLAPLHPGKIVAVGQNYMDHIREQGNEPPGVPVLFPKFPSNVVGPEEEIRWPKGLTQQVDYEAELAVVIGEGGRCLDEEDSLGAIFGYTAANDVTARDLQFSEGGQWTRGKAIDTFLPLGPVVVSRDEVPDPQALSVVCRVNGKTLQDSNTEEMVTRLNYAEHAFLKAPPDEPAIVHKSEVRPTGEVSWRELRERTAALAAGLKDMGVGRGDRSWPTSRTSRRRLWPCSRAPLWARYGPAAPRTSASGASWTASSR